MYPQIHHAKQCLMLIKDLGQSGARKFVQNLWKKLDGKGPWVHQQKYTKIMAARSNACIHDAHRHHLITRQCTCPESSSIVECFQMLQVQVVFMGLS